MGLCVQYKLNVLAIRHYSNDDNDTTRPFYRNGRPKSVEFSSRENLGTAVFFNQSGEVVDTGENLVSTDGHREVEKKENL